MNKFLSEAFRLRRDNINPVAIRPNTKRPEGVWREFQGRLIADDEIEAGWDAESPPWLGAVCGTISNLYVVDIDDPLLAERLIPNLIKQTRIVRTPSGGLHVWLRSKTPRRRAKLAPKVDFQGEGAIILCPPSPGYTTLNPDVELMWVPDPLEWAETLLNSIGVEPAPKKQEGRPVLEGRHLREGERNDNLYRFACWLVGRGAAYDSVYAQVWGINEQLCDPPLPEEEIDWIVQSACQHEPEGDFQPESAPAKEPPPREWLVGGLIPLRKRTIAYGDGGVAKSVLVEILGVCVAGGIDFLNLPTKQGPVLYLDWEEDAEEFWRRAYAIGRSLGLERPPETLHYFAPSGPLHEWEEQIRDYVALNGIILIVIDSLTAAVGGNVQNEERVIPFMMFLRSLETTILAVDHQSKAQADDQPGLKLPYGNVYKTNLSRAVFQVVLKDRQEGPDADFVECELKFRKGNYRVALPVNRYRITFEGKPEPTVIRLESWQVEKQQPARQRFLSLLREDGGWFTPEEAAERLGISVKTAQNQLPELCKSRDVAREPSPGGGGYRYRVVADSNPEIPKSP